MVVAEEQVDPAVDPGLVSPVGRQHYQLPAEEQVDREFDMSAVDYLAACSPPIEMKLSLLHFPLFALSDLPRAAKSLLTDLRDFLLGLL